MSTFVNIFVSLPFRRVSSTWCMQLNIILRRIS